MIRFRLFLFRALALFRRSRLEDDIDEEIRSHLEMEADEQQRKGLDPAQGRQAALRRFGGVDQVKERYRDGYRFQWIEAVLQDVRFAVRSLRKSPGFTAVAAITLALGIGTNTAVFTITNAALIKGFPLVKDNDRLLYISNRAVPYPDYEDWRQQAKSFSEMAAAQGLFKFVGGSAGAPAIYSGSPVTANAFHVLGVSPKLGRDFTPADAEQGAAPVTILTDDLWESRFASDPGVIGRSILLNGIPTTIVGVMPEGFAFPQKQDLWLPIAWNPDLLRRDRGYLMVAVGRMQEGATVQAARAELEAIARRLQREYPQANVGFPAVQTFTERFIGDSATALYKAMWGAVAFVLLIGCANVANLLLGRAAIRSRELSLRTALGAGRWRLARQLLVESLLLSSLGGFLGWWIAQLGVRVYVLTQRSDSWFAHVVPYAMDYRVFIYFIAICIGTGLLFGLVPAFRLRRLDVGSALKDGGHGIVGARNGKRLPAFLVAGEVALAVVLLAGAGVMLRSFLNIYDADIGADTANVLAAYIAFPSGSYEDGTSKIAFFDRLKAGVEAIPGVASMAVGLAPTEGSRRYEYEIDGALTIDERNRPAASAPVVSHGYFETLGATVLSGREFDDSDQPSTIPVAVVNERFAVRNWPGESAIGKRLRLVRDGKLEDWRTVVGVVSNIVQNDPTRQQFDPMIYLPFRQMPAEDLGILVRTRVRPETVITAIERQLQLVDSRLPFQHLVPLNAWMSRVGGAYELNRNIAILFLIFGTTALLMSSVGLYALVAQSVGERTQEIGIRTALGATAGDIRRLVLREGMLPLATGVAVGLAAVFAMNRVLQAQLVRVSSADPLTLAMVSAVLVASAALGCSIPARRAARVDPVVALKHQ